MYLYMIGYDSHEDSGSVELSHKKKICKKEFNNMFVESILYFLLEKREHWWGRTVDYEEGEIHDFSKEESEEILKEYPERLFDSGKTLTVEEYIEKYASRYYTQFGSIYDTVAKIMCEKYGFKIIKYEQQISVNGWGEIVLKDRDFGEDDVLLNRIAKKFWKRKKE